MAKCGVPREELFITTKVWISNVGYEKAKASIKDSLKKLQSDYINLLLIHQPFSDYYGTYHAMEEAYKEGKVRAIGVSNFYPDRFVDLSRFSEVQPAVNQVEAHVFQQQKKEKEIMNNPILKEIGKTHGKSVAQTVLRFLIQSGVVVILKSAHKERMEENFAVLDFSLSTNEMERIESLDGEVSLFFSDYNPSIVEWLADLVR